MKSILKRFFGPSRKVEVERRKKDKRRAKAAKKPTAVRKAVRYGEHRGA